jgi:hypothetical protein
MAERHQPPRGCAPLTATRRRQDRRHELSCGEIAGVDGPDTGLSRRHQRTPSGGPEGGRAQGKREEPGMVTGRGIDPFLKADLLTCAPKRHEQNLPRRIPGFLPYDMGARPHISYKPAGACNCPVVMCPFVFGTTSGREEEPPRRKRTTALRLCAPSASLQLAVQRVNPGPHVMQPARRLPGAEKPHRNSRQCRDPSEPSQQTEKISFQNQCGDSRHPAHDPAVALGAKITGRSTVKTGMATGVTIGRPAATASTGAQEQPANRQ